MVILYNLLRDSLSRTRIMPGEHGHDQKEQ